MPVNNETIMKFSGLSFLDLYKRPYKAGGKAGNFLGHYAQDGVCMKNKDADEK